MKNKKAVKSLVTINVLAMLTMLGQPVVKAPVTVAAQEARLSDYVDPRIGS